jgi:hypothetical protein
MHENHPVTDPRAWRTSTHTNGGGACVEVAPTRRGIDVRDSKTRARAELTYAAEAWAEFEARLKHN